jgi:hypothetical protein
MYNAYLDTEGESYVTKDYGDNNEELNETDLTEVFVVCYTIKKKGCKDPEEVYSFTTDFDQAFKRFKLLPNSKCFLKRFMTDDDELIRLAIEGTKPKPTDEEYEGADIKDIIDKFRDEDDDGKPIYESSVTTSEHEPKDIIELAEQTHACELGDPWDAERQD